MRTIVVRLELSVRPVKDAEAVGLFILLNLQSKHILC
jgi:hypothetical protein